MSGIPEAVLREVQQVGRDLYQHGLVTSHGGNISVREGDGMWITLSGARLGYLDRDQLTYVPPGGGNLGPPPSSDTVLHGTVYAVSGATAVVHAHPRHAVALTFEDEVFVPPDFEGQHHLQDVPVVDNDQRAPARVADALRSRLVVILRQHGAYARGRDPWEALHWLMALEESAQIAWLRAALGRGTG